MQRLKCYSWPGNLRELRNVIRRTVLFTAGDTITTVNLPSKEETKKEIEKKCLTMDADEEKERFVRALKANGNKSLAARCFRLTEKPFITRFVYII